MRIGGTWLGPRGPFATIDVEGPAFIYLSDAYLAAHDVYQRLLYQPADRYWRFQWIEAGIFGLLSGAFAF